MSTALPATVRARLEEQYAGVFDDKQLEQHIRFHLEPDGFAALVALVRQRCPNARTVLDIGAGFGSFVLACQRAGLDAVALEPEPVEAAFAETRTAAEGRGGSVIAADASRLPFAEASFDVTTMWHVLEHLDDRRAAIAEAARVLRPGGSLFVIAPNYGTVRGEPHYHVPWAPAFNGRLAAPWLRLMRRDPRFWEQSVRPCTAREIVDLLRAHGFEVHDLAADKLQDPSSVRSARARHAVTILNRLRLGAAAARMLGAAMNTPLRATLQVEARRLR